jgi:hypothetical protein
VNAGLFRYYFYNEFFITKPGSQMFAERPDRLGSAPMPFQSVGQMHSTWLSCYPFRDALQHGETVFRALPPYVKLPVLKRIATDTSARDVTSVFNEVRVAYIELITSCVVEAVESFLSARTHIDKSDDVHSTSVLDAVAAHFPSMSLPHIARHPCVLCPGKGIFLEGWARFFAYWSRNDKTIPLLAVDWPTLYEHVAQSVE